METSPSIPQVPIKGIASKLSDEDRMALLRKLSKSIKKNSFRLPRKSCKHCFGRGFIGFLNGLKSLPVPCRCTFVKIKK